MYDVEARHMIEALRSGVPSRAVGQYFSEARPKSQSVSTKYVNRENQAEWLFAESMGKEKHIF